ncbi:MAG: FGGY family carbohydrate kinase [Promethearchaeia archaeon]
MVSTKGKVIDWVFKEVPLHMPEPGAAEQDPDDWWNGIVEGVIKMMSSSKVSKDDIVGICNISQWSGTIPVDKKGKNLMNCIIWMEHVEQNKLIDFTRVYFKFLAIIFSRY